MIRVLVSFFMYQTCANIAALGTLVHASLVGGKLEGPMVVALTQAAASGAAFLISRLDFINKMPQVFFVVSFLVCAINFLAVVVIGKAHFFFLFFRLLFGSLLTSFYLSQGPRWIGGDLQIGNKKVQMFATLGALAGFGLAPILADGPQFMFSVDVVLSLVATIAVWQELGNLPGREVKEDSERDGSFMFSAIDSRVILIGFGSFVVWVFGGFFHVIEVPLLIKRFLLSKSAVSAIFVGTIFTNFLTLAISNAKRVSSHAWIYFFGAISIVALACVYYIYTSSIFVVIFLIVIIGIGNAVFNLSQSSLLQAVASTKHRLTAFVFARLMAQIGMVLGAILAGSGHFVDLVGVENSKQLDFTKANSNLELNITLRDLPNEITPYSSKSLGSSFVLRQVFESLFQYDHQNNLGTNLVESLSWKDGNQTLWIKLKSNRYFSDGTLLSARQVKDSLDETRKKMGPAGTWAFGLLSEIKVASEYEVEFKLTKPNALLPAVLASSAMGIFKRTTDGNIVGTGAYRVQGRTLEEIVLDPNPYRPLDSGAPSLIRFMNKAKNGYLYSLSDTDLGGEEKTMIPKEFQSLQVIVFVPNYRNSEMQDRQKRCAIVRRLSEISRLAYPEWSSVDLGVPFSATLFPVDPKTNKRGSLVRIEEGKIVFTNSAARFEGAGNLALQNNLESSGMSIKFIEVPVKELFNKIKEPTISGFMLGYIPDFAHPHALVAPLLGSGQTFNLGNYRNSEVDGLIANASQIQDRFQQNEIYAEVLRKVERDCAISFLGSQSSKLFVDRRLNWPTIGQLGFHNIDLSLVRKGTAQ